MKIRFAIGAATMVLAWPFAPVAQADTTITAVDICYEAGANLMPVWNPFQNVAACADNPGAVGVFYTPQPIPAFMHSRYAGSWQVDPGDAFSDWIIPNGARPAPPKPLIACDRNLHCGPDVVVPCSGPGAPCG